MSGSHFYLTLPSNSSLNIFPDNKTTSYRVKLPQAIDLNGDWEVGLYSISYPITWYTLQNHENHIYYSKDGLIFQTAIVDYALLISGSNFNSTWGVKITPYRRVKLVELNLL